MTKGSSFILKATVVLILALFVIYFVGGSTIDGLRFQTAPIIANVPLSLSDQQPQLLALAVCNWKFYINDKTSGNPIANARIVVYWNDPSTDTRAVYNTYTDTSGYATLGTLQYQFTYVSLEALGYSTQINGPIDSRGLQGGPPTLTYHWTMTQNSTSTANGAALTIYAQAGDTRDSITASLSLAGNSYYFGTTNYPYRVVVWGLAPNASYTAEIKGVYYHIVNDIPQSYSFDWVKSFITGANGSNMEYWIEVISGNVQTGSPPVAPVPVDPWKVFLDFINWMIQYWYIAVVLGLALYLSPWWLSVLGSSWLSKAKQVRKPKKKYS